MTPTVQIPEIGYYAYAIPEDFQEALVFAECSLHDDKGRGYSYPTKEAAQRDQDRLQQILTAFGYPLQGLTSTQIGLNDWKIKLRSSWVKFSFEGK